MRAIWKGSISFGLANIPVRLFSAVESVSLDLDMLHKADLSPVRYARICKEEEKEIPFDQIVKGYKEKGFGYVVISDQDFKKADVKKTSTISIVEFTGHDEISSLFYEKPYYLSPEKGAEKVYGLFLTALERSGKVGIAKFVIRNREHLAAIMPVGNIIVLNQLRFSEEIRNSEGIEIAREDYEQEQIELAESLINQMTRKFKPEDFKDTYTDSLRKLIRQKAEGKEVEVPKYKTTQTTNMNEIMKRLKQSLEEEKQKTGSWKK